MVVKQILKYILMLNLCLALVSLLGSAWTAREVGSQAYLAGAVAMVVVGIAASLALLLSFLHSRQANASKADSDKSVSGRGVSGSGNGVSGILLAMLIRMGLPMAVMLLMQQSNNPLLEAGFMGLLVLNYLVALPLETWMSLKFLRESDSKASSSQVSSTTVT